ncbi:MAG: hypothetical protein RBR87_08090 [Bacteroidales bacterium]|nr:hypothetical protein [Bacteroidales bacterium]
MKRIFILALGIILVFSFSCSKDSTETPEQQAEKYRLIRIAYDDSSMENYYTEKGQLRKTSTSDGSFREFIYDDNDKLVNVLDDFGEIELFYVGERLSQIDYFYFSDHHEFVFEYNDQNLIIKLISENSTSNLKYDNKGRLLTKVRIEDDVASPDYDSIIYKWRQDGNLLEKKRVQKYLYPVENGYDYRRYLVQENYEYDSHINPYSTIRLPDAYKLLRTIVYDFDESFSTNNVVETRQTTKIEFDNNPNNNSYKTNTSLFNVTESENNLPKRIESEWFSFNLQYEKHE